MLFNNENNTHCPAEAIMRDWTGQCYREIHQLCFYLRCKQKTYFLLPLRVAVLRVLVLTVEKFRCKICRLHEDHKVNALGNTLEFFKAMALLSSLSEYP